MIIDSEVSMEIILLENIRNLGTFGSKVSVARGYGRNYLIPTGKAVPATSENMQQFEERRAELEKAANDKLAFAQSKAASLEGLAIVIESKASEEGKLYGSVGTFDIVKAIAEAGIEIPRQAISLPLGAIREIGEFEVDILLHAEVTTQIKVKIVPEK